MAYVPLRLRSNYSLLTGASSVETMVEKAGRLGLSGLALTDEGNLYGAVPFFKAARGAGVRPILGSIVRGEEGEVVLLVSSEKGYANLCSILSARNLDEGFSLVESVSEGQDGLFILTADLPLAQMLAGRIDAGRLWLELRRPGGGRAAERALCVTAARYGLGIAATNDVYFAEKKDFDLHVLLSAMRGNTTMQQVRPSCLGRTGGYLRSGREMAELFADAPEALAGTLRIAEACRFDLLSLPTVFPRVEGDAAARLREEARQGARWRYGRITAAVRGRLDRELGLIIPMGFADYFLVVAEIVRYARRMGTPVAGRGSGASSIVAYCLGITNVDPIRFNLPFERFLNEGRADYPDLDVDFCWRLRDGVIDHVYKRYGGDHVAMIATYATLQPRLALRETAKAVGMENADVSAVMRKLQSGLPYERWGKLRIYVGMVERAIEYARRCEGFPHHLSVHCGGVVITPDSIRTHAPLQRAAKGVVITQYDKDGVEAAGLVKLDLLGNRALSSLAATVREIERTTGRRIETERLPQRDAATARALAAADVVGVCQLESPAMRRLLRQIRPDGPVKLMKTLGLIRPGAASLGMKEVFIRRARGLDPVPSIDPALDGVLKGSYGVMLFEDDALLVAKALMGRSAAEADTFRRAVVKCRSDDERLALSRDFLSRCAENGVDLALAADLWTQMAKFSSYSFCRAHAASYAGIAWANAWMKAHYRPEFWVSVLNNNAGMYEKWVYIEEAKREGVPARTPCVNRSEEEFSLEDGAIRMGLSHVRELSKASRESIRAARPFVGLQDVIVRTTIARAELENLIRAGGLDFTGRARMQLLFEVDMSFDNAKRLRGGTPLFGLEDPPLEDGGVFRDTETGRLRDEWAMLRMSTGRHPAAFLAEGAGGEEFARSGAIGSSLGKRLRLRGLAAAARTVEAANGGTVCFITLSDEDGLFEVTLQPEVCARQGHTVAEAMAGVMWVEGRAASNYDALYVEAESVGALPDAGARPALLATA